jgi:hypothetical protein
MQSLVLDDDDDAPGDDDHGTVFQTAVDENVESPDCMYTTPNRLTMPNMHSIFVLLSLIVFYFCHLLDFLSARECKSQRCAVEREAAPRPIARAPDRRSVSRSHSARASSTLSHQATQ